MKALQCRASRSLALLLVSVALACGGGDGGGTGPAPVASVAVTPPSATVNEFDSLQLTATPKDAAGNPLTGRTITWSTNAGTKATVSTTGKVHAFQPGPITVTATSEGVPGSSAITIVVPVAVITLNTSAVTLAVGDTFRLKATVLGPAGDPPTDSAVAWSSADTARATVTASGLVLARWPGAVTVTASAETKSASAQISIPTPVASVIVTPAADTIAESDSTTLSGIPRDSAGTPLAFRDVTWRSSDTTVAALAAGTNLVRVYGRAPGSASVIATSEGKSDTASILVVHVSVASVTITPDTVSLLLHNPLSLVATTLDSLGRALTDRPVHWSTSDAVIAPITPDSGPAVLVTAASPGIAAIVATSEARADTATITSQVVTYASIASGIRASCAATTDSLVYCWNEGAVPSVVVTPIRLGALTVGQGLLCGLAGGDAYCGDAPGTLTLVPGGHVFTAIAAGAFHTCAIAADSTGWCWGQNGGGQLGDSSLQESPTPVQVVGGHRFVSIATGAYTTCAIAETGDAYCWGSNLSGSLGTGDTASTRAYPVPVAGGLTFTSITMGSEHACALVAAGQAYCWGDNSYDQMGTGLASNVPAAVTGGISFTSIHAGLFYTCGIVAGGNGFCWGDNAWGQVGDSSFASTQPAPVQVAGGLSFLAFSGGLHDNCALTTTGAYCWGSFQVVPKRLPGQL
jgi:uncharacterized protein YjdB